MTGISEKCTNHSALYKEISIQKSISIPQLVSLANICTLLHFPDVCLVTVTTFPQSVYFAIRQTTWYCLSTHHLFACYVYTGREKAIQSLSVLSMQTWAIPSMCATFTNSLWEMDKWPISVQVHSSYTATFIHKWQLFITYTSCENRVQ